MKYIIILIASFLVTQVNFAQSNKYRKADQLFKSLAYKEAAKEYESAIETSEENTEILQRLGDCYYFNSDMQKAYRWYAHLIQRKPDSINPEYLFRYAHTLEGLGQHDSAKKWMRKFAKATKNTDLRKTAYAQENKTIDDILSLEERFKLQNLSVNTSNSDFGVGYYSDRIVYASAKEINNADDVYRWNGQPFLNLYLGYPDFEGIDVYDSELFAKELTTRYHEASAVFTKDLQKVYFTRNNYDTKLDSDANGVTHLKLYSARILEKNGFQKWGDIKELPFNSNDYSVGHPALNEDETKLYFTSDMPGSIGATDIFVVDILTGDSFSEPKNLGPTINTSGREMFPFVANDVLYFASDGHLGLGGLDVFESISSDSNGFESPINLGAPLNSNLDDFAFVINDKEGRGYVSSNRKGGKGDDDIYSFEKIKLSKRVKICEQQIVGVITNQLTGESIGNAIVKLKDANLNILESVLSNTDGTYVFKTLLKCGEPYSLNVTKVGYIPVIEKTVLPNETGITEIPIVIKTADKLIVEEKGVLKIKIGLIYFDFDKHFIRNDAAIELNKIVLLMNQFPKMVIKIESHTDSRGNDEYNRSLSDRRAKSTRDYIIESGIDQNRIESATGYGETQLVNKCSNGWSCSDSQHDLNRRSEFIILKM